MRMGQRIGRVIAHGSDVAEVIVQSFQFQKERAEILRAPRHFEVQERFNRLAIGETVSYCRISGHAFRQRHCIDQQLLLENFLNTAVFPKMAQLELHDRFTGHGKPKMSRLDNPGMDRSHRYFQYPFSFNMAEVMFALLSTEHAVPGEVFSERVCPLWPVFMAYQTPQVRMPLGNQPEHVANLAL